jgi:hypothetical protein
MSRNIHRKDRKKQYSRNYPSHPQSNTVNDMQLPLPVFVAENTSSADPTPSKIPRQSNSTSSKNASHSWDTLLQPIAKLPEETIEHEPSHDSNDALAEHTLANVDILVGSNKPGAMKLYYRFRDLVPYTGKPRLFCIERTK